MLLGRKAMTYLESLLKSRDITLPTKVHLVKATVFPIVMFGCETPKNWCFWTVLLEKTLESPLDCKEIQPVHPKGDQSWVFIGRTDDKAETPILWPPDVKNWLIWKDPDAGRQEEKGMTEDEIVGWHHRLNGRGFGWTLGVGDGQGGLVCCSPWGHKQLDMTEQPNWTELNPLEDRDTWKWRSEGQTSIIVQPTLRQAASGTLSCQIMKTILLDKFSDSHLWWVKLQSPTRYVLEPVTVILFGGKRGFFRFN